jgi:hypothetical protein
MTKQEIIKYIDAAIEPLEKEVAELREGISEFYHFQATVVPAMANIMKEHEKKYHTGEPVSTVGTESVHASKFEVGQKVWWDGIDGYHRQCAPEGEAEILRYDGTWCPYCLSTGPVSAWTTAEHLRPLPVEKPERTCKDCAYSEVGITDEPCVSCDRASKPHFIDSKPEHVEGEPCTLPISESCREIAKGLRFEYWEKREEYRKGEWTDNSVDQTIYRTPYNGRSLGLWILRAIPIVPKWQPEPGKWAWIDFNNGLVHFIGPRKILGTEGEWVYFEMEDGRKNAVHGKYLRPLTPEDWVKEIAGVTVSAEYEKNGNLLVVLDGLMRRYHKGTGRAFMEKFLRDNGVPIKPVDYEE